MTQEKISADRRRMPLWVAVAMVLFSVLVLSSSAAAVVDWVMNALTNFVVNFFLEGYTKLIEDLLKNTFNTFLFLNPDSADFKPLTDRLVKLLTPLYIVAIITTGFYWLFLSISPEGRARSKGMLLRLIFSMPFVMASTAIYQFMLDLSSMLVNFIFSLMPTMNATAFANIAITLITVGAGGATIMAAPMLILVLLVIVLLMLLMSCVRYILLFFLAAIFPLTIFMFVFEPTKDIGMKLLQYTLALAFAPALQAFFIIFTIVTISSGFNISVSIQDILAAFLARAGLFLAGCVLIIISPLIMMSLTKWVGLFMVGWSYSNASRLTEMGFGNVGLGIMGAGALLAGEGASAVPLAGGLWFLQQLGPHSKAGADRAKAGGKSAYGRRTGKGGGGGEGPLGGGGGEGGGPKGPGPKSPNIKTEKSTGRTLTAKDHLDNAKAYQKAGTANDKALKSVQTALDPNYSGTKLTREEMIAAHCVEGDIYVNMAGKSGGDKVTVNLEHAAVSYGEAVKLRPSQNKEAAAGYSRLAAAYEKAWTGRDKAPLAAAVENYKKAMDLDPSKHEYALKMADTLYKKG